MCTFCVSCAETTMYLFCLCYYVDQCWNDVIFWIGCYFRRKVDIKNFNKLFGFERFENQNITDLLNCFLHNARFLICRHKYAKTKPTISAFIDKLNGLKFRNTKLQNKVAILPDILINGIVFELFLMCCY